ncbi:unnamed protein product [Ixodes pacificus]
MYIKKTYHMSRIVNQNFLHTRNTRACALENPMFGSMTSRIFTTPERGRGGVETRAIMRFLATRRKRGRRDGTVKGLLPNAKEMPPCSKGSLGAFPDAAAFLFAWGGVFATADEASADWNVVANAERGQPQSGSTDKRRNWPTCLHTYKLWKQRKTKIRLARARQTGGASGLALGKAPRTLCSWNAVPLALVS